MVARETSRYRHLVVQARRPTTKWPDGGPVVSYGDKDMPDQDHADVRLALARLRQEHEDYDAAINAMIQTNCEALRIQRMKKKKLIIKDKMTQIEDQIIPDIIA